MSILLNEVWRVWRGALRRPGFLLLTASVLALGVGAIAAVYTLIDGVLLKPLPFAEPARLVAVGPMPRGQIRSASPEQYRNLAGLDGIKSLGLFEAHSPTMNISSSGTPEVVSALRGDRGLLPTLGVQMARGRNFSAQEDLPNGPRVVILTHGFWERRFAGRDDAIGSALQVEGAAHTIVGVLPEGFAIPGAAGEIMLPTALPTDSDEGTNYRVVARLADGVTVPGAASQVDMRLHAMYAAAGNRDWDQIKFSAMELEEVLHAKSRPVLMMFLASASLLLLIALVNLANLMLLRTLSRSHDAAVRGALGASGLRLALPPLAEGLLVGVIGALLGLGLASLGLALLQGFMPAEWQAGGGLRLSLASWPLGLALGVVSALLATLLGLWRGRATSTIDELREGGRSGIGRHNGRLGRILVIAQVAMATALLSVAGLFLHKLYSLSEVPLGFASQGVLTFELAPVQAKYPDTASVQELSRRLVERLRLLPGTTEVTATTNLPAGGPLGQFNMDMHLPAGEDFGAQYRGIDPGFFKLFGVPLLEGRAFERTDVQGGEAVAIVNRAFAEARYGGRALGQRIQRGSGANLWTARIVGVVGDTRQFGPLGEAPEVLYVPLNQVQDEVMQVFRRFEPMRFAIKVNGDPNGYRDGVRKAVAEIAQDQPVYNVDTMADIVRATTSEVRVNLLLVGIFAGLALLLAAAGLYAVMAVSVAAREREFGVRLALGAPTAGLIKLVLGNGLLQIAIGLVCGIGLALAMSRLLSSVLEQVGREAVNPTVLVGVSATLALAGLLACLPPAWRASRVPPMRALRGE
ncbi:duplicated orphan permease [Lysobacter sp. yr284]|uniref:ADOP family duplicated permease n=1 Tax=Lysobacter TaxID=68 RepID=UPI00089A5EC3|nr:ADOP family duplicated permease [Lysobacter sp. yr284]SDZ17773.1 duplicated orphan permease [Lysobacter sp. yr284]